MAPATPHGRGDTSRCTPPHLGSISGNTRALVYYFAYPGFAADDPQRFASLVHTLRAHSTNRTRYQLEAAVKVHHQAGCTCLLKKKESPVCGISAHTHSTYRAWCVGCASVKNRYIITRVIIAIDPNAPGWFAGFVGSAAEGGSHIITVG